MARGARRKKLIDGLRLLLLHPEVPKCGDCQAWLYDADWKRSQRGGQDIARPPGASPPCWKCPKSEHGKPNPGAELSDRNWLAYDYYRQCLADPTNLLPRDLVVVRNNALIQTVEGVLLRQGSELSMSRLVGAVLGGGGGRPKSKPHR